MIRVGDDYFSFLNALPTMLCLAVSTHRCHPLQNSSSPQNATFHFGPAYRLKKGKYIMAGNLGAPCIRYHNDRFYISQQTGKQHTTVYSRPNRGAARDSFTNEKSFSCDGPVLFNDDGKTILFGIRMRYTWQS